MKELSAGMVVGLVAGAVLCVAVSGIASADGPEAGVEARLARIERALIVDASGNLRIMAPGRVEILSREIRLSASQDATMLAGSNASIASQGLLSLEATNNVAVRSREVGVVSSTRTRVRSDGVLDLQGAAMLRVNGGARPAAGMGLDGTASPVVGVFVP